MTFTILAATGMGLVSNISLGIWLPRQVFPILPRTYGLSSLTIPFIAFPRVLPTSSQLKDAARASSILPQHYNLCTMSNKRSSL